MTVRRSLATWGILVACIAGLWFPYCRSLACAKRIDPWIQARYHPEIPLFLRADNVGARLNDLPLARQLAIGQMLMLLSSPDMPVTHPTTCAVVGNSGNLRGSRYGSDIDRHAYVFRMNNAPVQGFEADVGSRTTHHIVHSNHPDIRVYNDLAATVLIVNEIAINHGYPEDRALYDERVVQSLAYMISLREPARFPPFNITAIPDMRMDHFPLNALALPGPLYILHPEFLDAIDRYWFQPSNRTHRDYPSTGFKTLMLALCLCDSVDVYGFGINQQTQRWDHYFNDGGAGWTTAEIPHRAEYQEGFLHWLDKRGIIRLHPGNTQRNMP